MVDSSFNTDYYEDEDDKKSFLDKIKLAVGGITFALSIIIFFSLTSYIFTGQEDQSLVNSSVSFSTLSEESKNWLGVFGAFLSHYLVFKTFGISSFLFVPFLFVLSIRLLFRKKLYSISRIFILSIFGIIWISSILGFFLIIFPDNIFLNNYTGGVGFNLSLFFQNLLGYSSIIILLLSLFLFVVFYFNVYNFNLFSFKKKNLSDQDSSMIILL